MKMTFDQMAALVAENCYPERPATEIRPDSRFREDLGYDELDLVELAMDLDEALDNLVGPPAIRTEVSDMENCQTVLDLLNLINSLLDAHGNAPPEGVLADAISKIEKDASLALETKLTGQWSPESLQQMEETLREFIGDVNAGGGIKMGQDGYMVPLADDEWTDIAKTYLKACQILGVEPKVQEDEGDGSDYRGEVARESGTSVDEWSEISGPTTGVGIESWYRHDDGREAYVCDDQGEVKIDIGDPGSQ